MDVSKEESLKRAEENGSNDTIIVSKHTLIEILKLHTGLKRKLEEPDNSGNDMFVFTKRNYIEIMKLVTGARRKLKRLLNEDSRHTMEILRSL